MRSDSQQINEQLRSSSDAGISARLLQGIYGPAEDKKPVTEKISAGPAAMFMEMMDEGLYGKAYAQELRGGNKVEAETKVADAKVPQGFPPANIVGGENGYINFGAQDELAGKRDANTDTNKFFNFVDNRLAA